jgi:hypothetical protein
MFKSTLKASLIFSLISPIFVCQNGVCSSQKPYYEATGKESEAFMKAVRLIYDQGKPQEGFDKMKQLVKQEGDPHAFFLLIKSSNGDSRPFISRTRQHHLEHGNYDVLANMGKILADMERPIEGASFLQEAVKNKAKLTLNLEDVEFNYALSLCGAGMSLRTASFDPYKESWLILKNYLTHANEKQEFKTLLLVFFHNLKENNQEDLIHETGKYILERRHSLIMAQSVFCGLFSDTPHLERLLRQLNLGKPIRKEDIPKHLKDPNFAANTFHQHEQRKKEFTSRAAQQIEDTASKELATMLEEEQAVKDLLRTIGTDDLSGLTDTQKEAFVQVLIDQHSSRLFPITNLDVKEYLQDQQGKLNTPQEKKNFLLTKVFPSIPKARQSYLEDKGKDVVYNRLALLLKDNTNLSDLLSAFFTPQETPTEYYFSLSSIYIVGHHGHHLFNRVSQDNSELTPFDVYLGSLDTSQKLRMTTLAIKQILGIDT